MDFLKSLGGLFGSGELQGSGAESNIMDQLQGLINIDPEIIERISEIENNVLDLTNRANDMMDVINKYGKLAAFVFAMMFILIMILVILAVVQTSKLHKLETKISDLDGKIAKSQNSDKMNGLQ